MAERPKRDLRDLGEELLTLLRHPRTLGTWIEGQSPWLNRRFLGAASNFVEPFLAGMGLRVEKISEENSEVSLPGGRQNQGASGSLHTGALTALGEFTSRLYWEHHLDLRNSEMTSMRVEIRRLAQATGDVRAVYRLSVNEREKILNQLRADGRAEVEAPIAVYASSGRLVAEVDVTWTFARQMAIDGQGRG